MQRQLMLGLLILAGIFLLVHSGLTVAGCVKCVGSADTIIQHPPATGHCVGPCDLVEDCRSDVIDNNGYGCQSASPAQGGAPRCIVITAGATLIIRNISVPITCHVDENLQCQTLGGPWTCTETPQAVVLITPNSK